MKIKTLMCLFVIFGLGPCLIHAQLRSRKEILIPDIPGYYTLKCDFHIHTVFSDGTVWPSVRVDEAWREGLDAVAISEHLEYLPFKDDVKVNHNRAWHLADARAERYGIIVIQGTEITRSMPPGHFNAIFITDANAMNPDDYRSSIEIANRQGGFVFWNHPGWRGQQPDGISKWYDEHTELFNKGQMHGIEVVNGQEYYPEAHHWCIEKNLTLIGTSDVHDPIGMEVDFAAGEHRSMTLVFARERSAQAIHEALKEKRTAVYWKNSIIGDEKFLNAIFHSSVELKNPDIKLADDKDYYLQIHNQSQVPFFLVADGENDYISAPRNITLFPGRTVLVALRKKESGLSGQIETVLPYRAVNLITAPENGCPVRFVLNARLEQLHNPKSLKK